MDWAGQEKEARKPNECRGRQQPPQPAHDGRKGKGKGKRRGKQKEGEKKRKKRLLEEIVGD